MNHEGRAEFAEAPGTVEHPLKIGGADGAERDMAQWWVRVRRGFAGRTLYYLMRVNRRGDLAV